MSINKDKASKNYSYRINFMIDQEVKESLEQYVPSGMRSRVVNDALKKELDMLKRKQLTTELLDLRRKSIEADDVIMQDLIRKDRSRDSV